MGISRGGGRHPRDKSQLFKGLIMSFSLRVLLALFNLTFEKIKIPRIVC